MAFLNKIQQVIYKGTDVLFVQILKMAKRKGNGLMSPAVKLQRDIKLAQRFREAILVPMYLPEKKDSWKSSTGLMK